MVRYHIETYGCTANQGESREIERQLRAAGHHPVAGPAEADVSIINTCTVVEKTEMNMLRRVKDLESETDELIVTGCMAIAQGEIFERERIDARILHWDEVPSAMRNGDCPTATPDTEPILDGVIGILPIARGCMSNCSYCITKQATGRIESPPIEENVKKARALIHAGAKELRITGQDTGVYGWDAGERSLHRLLDEICSIDGDFKVRVGMANPKGIHGIRTALADVFATHDKLYNFLHIPVQSGSNRVLGDMRRQHQVREFIEVVETFDQALHEWTLSTDFIVGFPTETQADHNQSMDLLRSVRPEKVNITRFSKRPGTDAASLHGLNGQIKKDRSKEMSAVKREIVSEVYEDLVGKTREVLVVEPGFGDSVKCRDDAYHQVIIQNATAHGLEYGDRVPVRIDDHHDMYALGTPI